MVIDGGCGCGDGQMTTQEEDRDKLDLEDTMDWGRLQGLIDELGGENGLSTLIECHGRMGRLKGFCDRSPCFGDWLWASFIGDYGWLQHTRTGFVAILYMHSQRQRDTRPYAPHTHNHTHTHHIIISCMFIHI